MVSLASALLVPTLAILVPFFLLYSSSTLFTLVDFVEYHPLPKLPLEGVLAPNDRLKQAKRIGEGKLLGPETITFDDDGNLYTGSVDGNIYRVNSSDGAIEVYAHVGGRPLGLEFDAHKNLIICDSLKGLISVNPQTRQVTILTSQANNSKIFFADDLAISKSGKIYFTDASVIGPVQIGTHWDTASCTFSILSNDPCGRLLEYDPQTMETKVLLTGLVFANGVALSKNEDYILVCETGRPSIHRYYLKGPKAGQSDYFVENLPGLPDNINRAPDGRFFLSLYALRSGLEFLFPYPTIRKVLSAFLPFVDVVPKKIGFVGVLDENGTFVDSFFDQSGEVVYSVTDTQIRNGKLYMGSLIAPFIAVYDLEQK